METFFSERCPSPWNPREGREIPHRVSESPEVAEGSELGKEITMDMHSLVRPDRVSLEGLLSWGVCVLCFGGSVKYFMMRLLI